MKKKAFTLIELMVAMSIMIIVLSFGTVGVIRFRDYIELQNGYSDVSTYFRTIQNRARNAIAYTTVSGTPLTPDYYGIYIEDNNFSLYQCEEQPGNQADCTEIESEVKSSAFTNVEMAFTESCPGNMIGFKRSSVDVVAISGTALLGSINSGNIISTGNCELEITHVNNNSLRTISINLTQNAVNTD